METTINGAKGIIISIKSSADIGLDEVETACGIITDATNEDSNVIFGVSFDEALDDEMIITVIATSFGDPSDKNIDISSSYSKPEEKAPAVEEKNSVEDFSSSKKSSDDEDWFSSDIEKFFKK